MLGLFSNFSGPAFSQSRLALQIAVFSKPAAHRGLPFRGVFIIKIEPFALALTIKK
jgi:hypothetical protein